MADGGNQGDAGARRRQIRLGSRSVALPNNRYLRVGIGSALVVGGVFGFLPIVGFWMIPLGLFVLSMDMHWARRLRRRIAVGLSRRFPKIAKKINGSSQ